MYSRVTVTAKVKVDTFKGKLKPKLEFQRGGLKQKINALWGTGMVICWNNKMGKGFEQGAKESEFSKFHFLSFFLSFY